LPQWLHSCLSSVCSHAGASSGERGASPVARTAPQPVLTPTCTKAPWGDKLGKRPGDISEQGSGSSCLCFTCSAENLSLLVKHGVAEIKSKCRGERLHTRDSHGCSRGRRGTIRRRNPALHCQ